MLTVTNISTYQFAPLQNLKPLRGELLSQCIEWNLKGTILLSSEGVNLFVAGDSNRIVKLIERLRKVPGLENLTPKISESDHQPFTRMLVKIKKEIIAFGVEGIDPSKRTSPKLPAKQLKQWLDEGRPITLLDTRNDYEVKLGTFKNALPIGVDHFRDFPEAVHKLPDAMKESTVVMFCTGGIRCEKAGPYMEREGFKNVFQLEGGILKYFEECGGDHYEGGCFVFDQRVGVDPSLQETEDKQCFICLSPLTKDDQSDSRYSLGKSCPYCFKTPEVEMAERLILRNKDLAIFTNPLPGKNPYDNLIPMKIPEKYEGITLSEFLGKAFPYQPVGFWELECRLGRILDSQNHIVEAIQTIKAGERYLHLKAATSEPDVNAEISILYEDEAIIVLDKPAPLPVHPSGRYNRNTLKYILDKLYYPLVPQPAHRLDANTCGVMVFSKTKHFAGLIQPQFANNSVEKVYIARVEGHPHEDSFTCELPIGNEVQKLGSRQIDELGQEAITHFKVLEKYPDNTTLLEVRPLTGRTNQIRVHLWKLGFPICNDPVYLVNQKLGDTQTVEIEAKPLLLQSYQIAFTHPVSHERVTFQSALPIVR